MNNHVIIIAEVGVNHNGDYELAKQLVIKAKEAGVDYVKFQTAKPELVISKFAEMADYQKVNMGKVESQLEMCKKIHLKLDDYKPLKSFCENIGVKFISTPFDLVSIDVLEELDLDFWKIPSGEITNYPYLVKIAKTHRPVVMSTGMCEVSEIRAAINVLLNNGLNKSQISLLHCNTEYPTPYEDVNLNAINFLKTEFDMEVGYSDHTSGIEVPIAAVAIGATIIEKHFTLDKTMEGPDHKASLEPNELKAMVSAIRNIERAVSGNGQKHVSNSERKNIPIARKSIVASCVIKKGEILSESNLMVKRPGNGISPMLWNEVVGKIAIRDFVEDELIEL